MWSLPRGPQLWSSSGLPQSPPCQDPEGEALGTVSELGPRGHTRAPLGTPLPASGPWRGWGVLRPVRPGP